MIRQVIYIPGLGDHRVHGQAVAVRTWQLWGVQSQLFQMNWADGEAFAPKLARLLALIDKLAVNGSVSLVAASAGAGAAINAFAARKNQIEGVVCIAGKIHYPEAIGERLIDKNPAFWESSQQVASSLNSLTAADRQRILSIRGLIDPLVPARDSRLDGAHNRVTWTFGHLITIATQLVFGAPFFLRFLKRQSR